MSKKKIFIAGHNGMVGSALLRILKKKKKFKLITRDKSRLDLTDQTKVKNFFKKENIDQVYIAAAKVGGIEANLNYPAEFIYKNLMISANIINAAYQNGVKKLLFLGSSCIYPKNINNPITETQLLSGKLELTNEPYAISKIAGIKLCESYNRQYGKNFFIDYRSIMPCNLYGYGDNYHANNSHVIPALIRRFHEAKISNKPFVTIWGSGKPKREFLFVDDMARAAIFIMNLKKSEYEKNTHKMNSHINVGSGKDYTILNLAKIIREIVGYKGKIVLDRTKPDGTFRKLMNSRKINKLGWYPKENLRSGLIKTYQDYLKLK